MAKYYVINILQKNIVGAGIESPEKKRESEVEVFACLMSRIREKEEDNPTC